MSADQNGGMPRSGLTMLKFTSMAALVIALFGRAFSPSDLWDHTQTRTVSYTTDILVHGGSHWILPIERGEVPATKPPLYNWIAAPMVKWLGFSSEVAHRFPSIAALCLCWLVIVRLGNAIDGDNRPPSLGWLAGLALVANYSLFKIGYLARPDMLLTLWLLLGWTCATRILIHPDSLTGPARRMLIVGFWACVTLAALTKGPAALVLPVYGVLAAKILRGSWRAAGMLHLMWGLPIVGAVVGLWFYDAWRINPDHVVNKLFHDEIYGRVTGTGPEGSRRGPLGLLIDLPLYAGYFVMRFLPWSIPAICAMWSVYNSRRSTGAHPWMTAATLFTLTVIGLFSLSAGKRAEYIAGAMPMCAILAAWWLLNGWKQLAVQRPWLAPLAGMITLASCIGYEQIENGAPHLGFSQGIHRFIDQAADRIASEPLAGGVKFCWTGDVQVQAMLGASEVDGYEGVFAAIEFGHPFWLVAGRKTSEPHEFAQWLRPRRPTVKVEPVIESRKMARDQGWPEQMTLYRVTP